jgi:putative hydrolase
VSSSNPLGGDVPFFDFNSLLGGLSGADPWKAATEIAMSIASDGGSEHNIDPAIRLAVEDLARVAELHVQQAAGVRLPPDTRVSAVTKSVWAAQSVAAYRPFFERFGEALSASMEAETSTFMTELGGDQGDDLEPADSPSGDPMADMVGLFPAQMMSQLFSTLGPMLVSTSAGSMIGHLGRQALGQYDLPIPRSGSEVLVVPGNIDETAIEWDVPANDLRLWVLVHDLVAHAVLSVPHVKARLEALLLDFASAFRPNQQAIAERFGTITDIAQMQQLSEDIGNPDVVLSLMRSPAHDLLVPQLDALVAAILGFVRHTVAEITDGLVMSRARIEERIWERWTDVAPADRFMERLLGLEIDEQTLNRGRNFIDGIVDRTGEVGLIRLWGDELDLPTAAEVDAPGLWLARIGLDDDADSLSLDVPDDLSGLDDDPTWGDDD